jgi:hypothetical protein
VKYQPVSSLIHIVYTSAATETFAKADLKELLKGSVKRNSLAGITGLLLFKDGSFMQALEGEPAVVQALFSKIKRDPRHHHIIPLLEEPIPQRNFPDSAMAFRDLESAELRHQTGYSEFLNLPLSGDLYSRDLPKCQRLLQLFKKITR